MNFNDKGLTNTPEKLRELARDPEHLKKLVALWADNTFVHHLAAELLAVREAQSVPVTAEDITEIMAQEWSEWCSDTGHFPDDFEWRGGNGILTYEPSRWSLRVAERILKLTAPPPACACGAGGNALRFLRSR